MPVSGLCACYLLTIIESLMAIDAERAKVILDSTNALLDKAFRPLFEIYARNAFSPLPEELQAVWKRLAAVAPTILEPSL